MPGSAVEGKELIKDFIVRNNLKTVLDIGPGEGTYYELLKDVPDVFIEGIEVWAPYVTQFNLQDKYNKIYIGDAYYFDTPALGTFDITLLGDVVEHLPYEQGTGLITKVASHSRYVMVSLPIVNYPQGTSFDGNWFEAHLEQYSDGRISTTIQDILGYEILESFRGNIIGHYIFKGEIA